MVIEKFFNVWGGGQLLAFSGIDGKTDYYRGLVARTAFDRTGLDIKSPVTNELTFSFHQPHSVSLQPVTHPGS